MKSLFEQLKPQVDLAEKCNSRIAVENHADSLLGSKDSFKAFVELNRNPRLGIALAPYHLQAAGISVEEVIEIAGKQLLFFYAWQHADGMKQLPGIGPADFTPWIAALARTGYAEYVNPFMHGHPGPEEMAKGLATAEIILSAAAERPSTPICGPLARRARGVVCRVLPANCKMSVEPFLRSLTLRTVT